MPLRRWSFLVVLSLVVGCDGCESEGETVDVGASIERPAPDLRIVAITDLQGTLAPCGCTSRPLGGIDRMVRFVEDAGEDILFVSAGNVLAGGPHHGGPESEETDRWKSEAVAAILSAEDVRAMNGPADTECGVDLPGAVLFGSENATSIIDVADSKVGLIALRSPGDVSSLATHAQDLRNEGANVVLVLGYGTRRMLRDAAATPGVDFVLQGGLDAEDALPPSESEPGWLLHAGRQGQHVLTLDLYLRGEGTFTNISEWNVEVDRGRLNAEIEDLNARLEEWTADGRSAEELGPQRARLAALETELQALRVPSLPTGSPSFSAALTELDPDMERSASVQEELAALDLRINGHNREAYAGRTPPAPAEGAPHYVGSGACASCHEEAFTWWQGHPHGRAYATLEAVNKEFHLDCVGCHVTGYERPGGSTVTYNLDGALTNVGCENCHGPASQHVSEPTVHSLRAETEESTCTGCHNEEHSDLFNYEVYRQTLMVPGHGRPAL
ncbi:MAG: multiheme c-type cytochrome [Polyangiales bacterium]